METTERIRKKVVNNFFGKITNYYEAPVTYNAPVYNNEVRQNATTTAGKAQEMGQGTEQCGVPSPMEMQAAVEETIRKGLWWSNRSWSVAYRVYQMKGYQQSISQFVRDVAEWNVAKGFECNYDAVQKPIAQGLLIGDPKKWVDNGAQKQAPALAEATLNLLDK